MEYTAYRDIPSKLLAREDFRSNSVIGSREDGEYRVYSYGTLIFVEKADGEVIFDNSFYSRTTSRIQNLIKNTYQLLV